MEQNAMERFEAIADTLGTFVTPGIVETLGQ